MAIEVELPDGTVAEFPDGTDNGTIERALQQQFKPPPAPPSLIAGGQPFAAVGPTQQSAPYSPYAQGLETPERIAAKSMELDFNDPEYIAKQASIRVADRQRQFQDANPLAQFVAGAASVPHKTAMGIGQLLGTQGNQDAENQRAEMAMMEGSGYASAGKVGGELAMFAAPLSKLGKLSGMARYVGAAGAGATQGAIQPIVDGESRGANTGIGAALGTAGQYGADKLLRAGSRAATAIAPEVRALYESAKARGISLSPAQLSDSKGVKYAQSILSKLPLSGAAKRAGVQISGWNRALAKAIGEDADSVTPEVYARAKARQSAQFNELTGRNNLKVDDALIGKLEAIKEEALMAGDDAAKAVSNAVDGFYRRVQSSGGSDTVAGRAYQALDAQLGKVTKLGNEASHYVGQVRDAIRSQMDDSISPADAKAWKALRTEYGNRKTVRDLVAKSEGGNLSPSQLMGRVTANNAGKESMASGSRGELGTLARIGQRIKEPASSGTAERLGNMAVGAGAITSLPVTAGGLLAGRLAGNVLDSNFLSRFLLREGRGKGAQFLAPYMRNASLAAVPAATPKAKKKLKD